VAGTQRFRILKVLEQRPVLIAECEILDEKSEEEDSVEVRARRLGLCCACSFCLLCVLLSR